LHAESLLVKRDRAADISYTKNNVVNSYNH
jgi:hypothetical protein